jgi:hypothetical protein
MSRKYHSSAAIKKYRGVEITVNSDGQFRARMDLDFLKADRLVDLQRQIDKLIKRRKVKIAIPVTQLRKSWSDTGGYSYRGRSGWVSGRGVRHLVLTGLHANGNVYAKDVKTGETEQLDYRYGEIVRRLTDEEAAEFTRLYTASCEASDALHKFEESIQIEDPRTLVQRAREAAASDAAVPAMEAEPELDPLR